MNSQCWKCSGKGVLVIPGTGLCDVCDACEGRWAAEDERLGFERKSPVPAWAEWSDTEQAYVKREDHICSATALAMYRKAYQAWMARAAKEDV